MKKKGKLKARKRAPLNGPLRPPIRRTRALEVGTLSREGVEMAVTRLQYRVDRHIIQEFQA